MRSQWREAAGEYLQVLIVSLTLAVLITTFVVQPFMVDGSSMEPSLHSGERLLVSKLDYRWRQPHRLDVVVFHYPLNPRLRFIKRVVGLPGEVVAIHDGGVYVNGRLLGEPYLADETYGTFGPAKVPAGHLFVLGDNRANSKDSRYPEVGMVDRREIVGHAVAAYWPLALLGVIRSPRPAAGR